MGGGEEDLAWRRSWKTLVERLIGWPVGRRGKREARRLRGSVDQTRREYRVWSIEYRRRQALKGGSIGRPDGWIGAWDRSIFSGFRFPFEPMSCFRWQVAGGGSGWRVAGLLPRYRFSPLSSIQSSMQPPYWSGACGVTVGANGVRVDDRAGHPYQARRARPTLSPRG